MIAVSSFHSTSSTEETVVPRVRFIMRTSEWIHWSSRLSCKEMWANELRLSPSIPVVILESHDLELRAQISSTVFLCGKASIDFIDLPTCENLRGMNVRHFSRWPLRSCFYVIFHMFHSLNQPIQPTLMTRTEQDARDGPLFVQFSSASLELLAGSGLRQLCD